jgi:hypothetical protein
VQRNQNIRGGFVVFKYRGPKSQLLQTYFKTTMLKTNFHAQNKANISSKTKYANLRAIFEDYNKITHINMKIKYIKNLLMINSNIGFI